MMAASSAILTGLWSGSSSTAVSMHDDRAAHRHCLSETSMAKLYPTRENDDASDAWHPRQHR
jgi:hypothetical protein